MQALKPYPDNKDIFPNNGLSVARAAFRPAIDFTRSRLDGALAGMCITRRLAPPRGLTPVDAMPPPARADHDLVVRLCRLPPDLAAPLLRSNLPALTPAALLTVIAATGEAHHRLIAARRGIDGRVVKALIRRGQTAALIALAENDSVDLDDDDQRALAAAGEHVEAVRAALLARPGLAVAHALLNPVPEGLSHSNLKLVKLMRAGDDAAFAVEIARRLRLAPAIAAAALARPSPVPLALAACAAGLDQAVFLDLLRHRQTAHGETELNAAHRPLVLSVFALPPEEARKRLMALANSAM